MTQTMPQTQDPRIAFRAEAQAMLARFIESNDGDTDLTPDQRHALYDVAKKHGVDLAID